MLAKFVNSETLLAIVVSDLISEGEEEMAEMISEVKLGPDSIVVGEAPVVTTVTV